MNYFIVLLYLKDDISIDKVYIISVSLDSSRSGVLQVCIFMARSRALFTGPANTEFSKFCFKTRSHCTIYTFKNYFVTIFSAINFQFSTISSIQTDLKLVVIITSFEKKMIINLILVFPLKVEINLSHF